MLPPMLQGIKMKLEAKGYQKRTSVEDSLLGELIELDQLLPSDIIRKNERFNESRIVGGPTGRCACCGQ